MTALGHFLEKEFRALLGTVPAGKHVAPLTVVTIQDSENLEDVDSTISAWWSWLKDYSGNGNDSHLKGGHASRLRSPPLAATRA